MLAHKPLRRADIVASSAMIGLGGIVVYGATRMPWSSTVTGSSDQWYVSPGLFPAVIGVLLIVFNLRVLVTAIKEGGCEGLWSSTVGWFGRLPQNRPVQRVLLITLLMSIYVFAAVGRVNFLLASGGFLFLTIALFWWGDGEGKLGKKIFVTFAVSAGVPFVFTYLFHVFLYVPMP
ncbi:tripartite tricarboxylate transporter TctB family protein [Lentibacter algarum]|uniref:tripartite tricarboxylate transporter TctB family protein n=1 Tax=Lentibacter algarum TaxID=576131 RepID=UPI001C07E66B|nr:tripartite tricarboxylate transporter TctB family protein [Lentibacter algarum]MBU2980206.1 tripartite tricarboxylate transporter TctB family protein [Lentibacter algarum]